MKNPQPKNPFDAAEYARLTGFDGKWRDTWWRNDFLEMIVKRRELGDAKSLLDVGCGHGHWGRTLSRVLPPGLHVAGVDIERAFVDQAAELGASFGLASMDYREGAGEALPFEDDSFDIATTQTVLIQVQDPAVILAEMKRVLKPGGTILLAEPNNLGGFFVTLMAEPRLDWPDAMKLVDCYRTCVEGKKALGFGDSALGEILPGLVAAAGFEAVDVALNENCPSLVPPYESEAQQLRLEIEAGAHARMGFGPRDNVRRFFLAGGGQEADFDALWDLAVAAQSKIDEAIEAKTYVSGRGAGMYLVTGRKPGSPNAPA